VKDGKMWCVGRWLARWIFVPGERECEDDRCPFCDVVVVVVDAFCEGE